MLAESGDAIQIRALKRYASDYELSRRALSSEPCEIIYKEKIAIIGAGPAGLTAAVDLIRLGYPVIVFEAKKDPGGMLRYGIPVYRLPERILKREIDWIKSLGVKIKTDKKIKDPSELINQGFSAVLVAGGAPKSFPLGLEGGKSKGVIDALDFLNKVNTKKPVNISANVVVIGGGSTAFDAARSAVRLGAKKVVLAYRRGFEEMPADKEEIAEAQDEGVEIVTLAIPKKILTKNKNTIGVEFLKAKLGKPDSSGRRRPEPIKASEFTIKANTVIPAIGAMPDIRPIGGVKVTTPRGVIEVSEKGETPVEAIFAAGDVEMGPSSVVDAIGRGHNAARGIHEYLKGKTIKKAEQLLQSVQIYLGPSICRKTQHFAKRNIKPGKTDSFEEVEGSFTDYQAVEEALRCFSRGPCYACPVCLPNCDNKQLIAEIENTTFLVKSPPELSEHVSKEGPINLKLKVDNKIKSMKLYGLTSVVDPDLCIGCGRCEEVCAYRAIKNVFSKNKQTVSQVDHNACASCSACVSECPSGAISQGFMSDDDILKRITDKKTPYKGIKALMSFWSTMTPVLESKEGIVQLMSARKPSPSFLIRALSNSGRGLLVIKPDEITGSHYLPWEEHPDDVIDRTLKLLDSIGISRKRIKYLEKSNALDTKKLLEKYSKELDNNCLNHLNLPKLKNIKSPLGKTIALLRIMSANPDLEPTDEYNTLEQIKKGGNAFFEGCIPLINSVGVAHNFYDISKTRESIYELIKILELNLGKIKGFNCPSKGLLKLDWKESDKLVRKIKENNIKIYDKLKPKSIAVATPEASLSFSKDKRFGEIKNFPEILLKKIDSQKLNKINLTIGIHHACRLDEDPFYEPIKKILNKIPGIKTVDLKNLCGQSGFEELNAKSKQKAVSLLKEASSKGADIILCTSPYCQSHLLLCHREGSWRAVDIEISDIYRILLASINGDM
jgi:NADPH-dependent glutamate synthase beta subunit-like oxidoreductase/ferredoxin/coenzyme F420-reducing hydrogenase delta subunit